MTKVPEVEPNTEITWHGNIRHAPEQTFLGRVMNKTFHHTAKVHDQKLAKPFSICCAIKYSTSVNRHLKLVQYQSKCFCFSLYDLEQSKETAKLEMFQILKQTLLSGCKYSSANMKVSRDLIVNNKASLYLCISPLLTDTFIYAFIYLLIIYAFIVTDTVLFTRKKLSKLCCFANYLFLLQKGTKLTLK